MPMFILGPDELWHRCEMCLYTDVNLRISTLNQLCHDPDPILVSGSQRQTDSLASILFTMPYMLLPERISYGIDQLVSARVSGFIEIPATLSSPSWSQTSFIFSKT